jgi:ribosomal protein S18 acetylase RimI-like enzyme
VILEIFSDDRAQEQSPDPGIRYVGSADGIRHDQLAGGFFVGWPVKPSPQRHLELLRGSYAVELALDAGQVIGFATAISDGVLSAYIPLLEVLPEYQGRGIGTELMERLVARLGGLYMIDLSCVAGLEGFYERLGFQPLDRAMGQRNRDNLG